MIHISDDDIRSVVKNVMATTKQNINEAYVSSPKTFNQATSMLSQKSRDAHNELYLEYISSLNDVSSNLDAVSKEDVNSMNSKFRSLKLDEAFNFNAKQLHELFFANCFDPNSQIYMDSNTFMKLQRDFGTFDDWQQDFLACAMACGEGWAICCYNFYLKKYINTMISHHSADVMLGTFPIIVLDMWSHTYNRDYLIDKKSYAIAMMKEINWRVVEDRVAVAEKIASIK